MGSSLEGVEVPPSLQLIEALRENNPANVLQAIKMKADVNFVEAGTRRRGLLHFALECGGNVDSVSHLLNAQADVNSTMGLGKTPLHIAVQQYLTLPFAVLRMLVCAKADFSIPDSRGVTPLDGAKMIAMKAAQAGSNKAEPRQSTMLRLLLNEISERPTVALQVQDCWEVRGAEFADMENDKIVFYTESTFGLYSLAQKRTIFTKRLRQSQVQSSVILASVNPELGTIAVCLEIKSTASLADQVQNVILVWPNGQLQYEEPLKLSIKVGTNEDRRQSDALPACVILSRTKGTQTLVCRLADRQVFRWCLNSARSQLVGETKLTGSGGVLAADDDGCWIAVAKTDADEIEVWHVRDDPSTISICTYVKKRPSVMAVGRLQRDGAYLALSVDMGTSGQVAPVEVMHISISGEVKNIYRLALGYSCRSLAFCHRAHDRIVGSDSDGIVILSHLPEGKLHMCHDSPGMRCVSASPDRTLAISAEANHFRVFKLNWSGSD
eukprot:TRINITY_DN63012_c0_g1_i1.p1 TRINITY_DN63012_c0_g1~~TRINITY_DN63012_c0_g1_i1.p1  ORF type:complete len:496 (+),score=76.82 TRINITY_DN63012_c0_g1_i1:3-1490(+)